MDEKDELEKPHKTLKEIDEENMNALKQFLFIIWTPNPVTKKVKITLDDGIIKIIMNYDKFISLMQDILGESYDNVDNLLKVMAFINDSLCEYSGTYYLDRTNNIFRELTQIEIYNKLLPSQVMKDARKEIDEDNDKENLLKSKLAEKITEQNRKAYDKKAKVKNSPYYVYGGW